MPRWVLDIAGGFEAAHRLYSWRGRPEPVHGHSFRVIARLESTRLDDEGMAFDFVAVRDALREITAGVDHGDLNAVPPFDVESPTAERIARWIFDRLREALPEAPLVAVTVFEGSDASATYHPDNDVES